MSQTKPRKRRMAKPGCDPAGCFVPIHLAPLQDPGVPGYAPRVWAYRNTIKALNWHVHPVAVLTCAHGQHTLRTFAVHTVCSRVTAM